MNCIALHWKLKDLAAPLVPSSCGGEQGVCLSTIKDDDKPASLQFIQTGHVSMRSFISLAFWPKARESKNSYINVFPLRGTMEKGVKVTVYQTKG